MTYVKAKQKGTNNFYKILKGTKFLKNYEAVLV